MCGTTKSVLRFDVHMRYCRVCVYRTATLRSCLAEALRHDRVHAKPLNRSDDGCGFMARPTSGCRCLNKKMEAAVWRATASESRCPHTHSISIGAVASVRSVNIQPLRSLDLISISKAMYLLTSTTIKRSFQTARSFTHTPTPSKHSHPSPLLRQQAQTPFTNTTPANAYLHTHAEYHTSVPDTLHPQRRRAPWFATPFIPQTRFREVSE